MDDVQGRIGGRKIYGEGSKKEEKADEKSEQSKTRSEVIRMDNNEYYGLGGGEGGGGRGGVGEYISTASLVVVVIVSFIYGRPEEQIHKGDVVVVNERVVGRHYPLPTTPSPSAGTQHVISLLFITKACHLECNFAGQVRVWVCRGRPEGGGGTGGGGGRKVSWLSEKETPASGWLPQIIVTEAATQ